LIGTSESLIYAYKSGLDPEQVINALLPGGGGTWSLGVYGPRILNRDFKPGFYVAHFVKDLGIALVEAKRLGLELKGTELAHELYTELRDKIQDEDGKGSEQGVQALIKVLEKIAGVKVKKKE
jgi:3-hydroxyisobutyrate dehydrogenase